MLSLSLLVCAESVTYVPISPSINSKISVHSLTAYFSHIGQRNLTPTREEHVNENLENATRVRTTGKFIAKEAQR